MRKRSFLAVAVLLAVSLGTSTLEAQMTRDSVCTDMSVFGNCRRWRVVEKTVVASAPVMVADTAAVRAARQAVIDSMTAAMKTQVQPTPRRAAASVGPVRRPTSVRAQANPEGWPVCQLGRAPIAPGPAPSEAVVFRTTGGPVVMSEAGPPGAERQVRFVSCKIAPGTEVYRGADGTLRDLPSNQPFWPVGWDAAPPEQLIGPAGPMGPMGPPGPMGPQGLAGEVKKAREAHRFCSSWLGCRIPLALVAAGIGYGAYRCLTDLCRIENTNTNINNNPGMAPAGFQLRVPLF